MDRRVLARAPALKIPDSKQRPDGARNPAWAPRIATILWLPAAVAAWLGLLAVFDPGGPPIAFVLLTMVLAIPFGLPL